jgi:two-component system sensor histidine kinase UhpB
MSFRQRDVAALVLVAFTFLLGTIAWSTGPGVTGMHLVLQNDQVVIASVDPGSPAALNGVQTGMIVVQLEGADVLGASLATKASIVANPRGWQWLQALWPDQIPTELAAREQLAREQAREQAAQAAASPPPLDGGSTEGQPIGQDINFPAYVMVDFYFPDVYRSNSLPSVFLGLAILIVGIWWLGTGRAGPSLRRVAITLPAATAMPLFALPVQLMPTLPFLITSFVVIPVGMLPLAADFCDRLDDPALAGHLRGVAAVLASASILAGVTFVAGADFGWHSTWSAVLAGCVVFVPGLLAARPAFLNEAADASGSAPAPGRFVESTELVLAAATPTVALTALVFRDWNPFVWPLLIWLVAILLARRFTLRPLLRLANRATVQRDVVVAATEAERARIAADIHDDALQDLTMLVRRLDVAGDVQNAESARAIAVRLRGICGDLRLPVLDDLGLGPALDWLTERFEPMAGGPVYLERLRDEPRLPANVELAIFRIAQEALANAVKHGAPPIVVRYRAGGTWAELDVDDSGHGLAPRAAEFAEQSGHQGLLNMTQRAESVGAELRIGRRPGGGTRVGVVWEAGAIASSAGNGADSVAASTPAAAPALSTPAAARAPSA